MDLLTTFEIAASGLSAQRTRMQTVATNMANARTTRTDAGGPYRRRAPVFEARAVNPFDEVFGEALATVEVSEVWESESPGVRHHMPDHPDADADGYVTMPDINIMHEMVDLMTTGRSYEANANALEATRDMALRALEIGR